MVIPSMCNSYSKKMWWIFFWLQQQLRRKWKRSGRRIWVWRISIQLRII